MTMRHTKHAQQVLNLLNEQGILRPSDLDSIGVPRVVLTRMTSAGLLEKVSRGLYRLPHSPVLNTRVLLLLQNGHQRPFSAYSQHFNFMS